MTIDASIEIAYRRRTIVSSGFSWKGKISGPAGPEPQQDKPRPKDRKVRSEQDLCDELFEKGNMISCHVFSMDGKILGTNFGEIKVDDELRDTFGVMAARVWSDIRRAEGVGGAFRLVTISYDNFKIIGIPFQEHRIGILVVVEDKVDVNYMRDAVVNFVNYWNSIYSLRERVRED